MSNPFKLIRRYQKQMMVVFGVILMASFGLGTVLSTVGDRGVDGRGGRPAATVVKWRGGSLTDAELDRFRERHFQTQAFLSEVLSRGADENMTLKVPYPLMPIGREEQGREFADRTTVELMMLAEKARQEGFVVGDDAVDQYLTSLGNNKVTTEEFPVILKTISDRLSMQQLKDHLKSELAAINYELALRSGLGGAKLFDLLQGRGGTLQNAAVNPVEAWDAFERLNRKATCDIMEIDVEEHVDEVSDEPSKDEIKKIYEEGKGDFPDPTHEKPGFKIHNQAKFGAFIIDRNAIVRREQQKISDEEVQKVYAEWVAKKDKRVIDTTKAEDETKQPPLIPPKDGEEQKDGEEKKETGESNSSKDQSKEESPEKKEDAGEQKGEPKKSPDSEPKSEDAEKNSADDPAADAGKDDAEPAKDGADEPQKNDAACGFEVNSPSQEESAQSSAGTAQAAEKKSGDAGEQKTADEKSDDESGEKLEQVSDDEKSKVDSGEQKSDDPQEPSKEEPAKESTEQPSAIPPEGVAQPALKIKPLDENLTQLIRSSLVNFEKVEELVEAAQAACAEEIDNYYVEYDAWKGSENSGEKEEEPVLPDFDKVARANRVSYEETAELMTEEEFLDHPLGRERLFLIQQTPGGQPSFQQPPLAQFVFEQFERKNLYQRIDGRGDKTYLIWFIEKVDAHTPKLEECRSQVIKYWQYQQGLAAAKKEADEIASEVESSKQTLAAAHPGKTKSTEPFTWMSSDRFNQNAPPDISPVFEVDNAGEEFMNTVFSLKVGDVGKAANASNDKVYVIQLTDIDEQEDVLQEQFFRTPALGSQGSVANILRVERIVQEIKEQILEEMDVQWVDAKKK